MGLILVGLVAGVIGCWFLWNILVLFGCIVAFIASGSLYIFLWLCQKKQPLLLGFFISAILFVVGIVGGAFTRHHGHEAHSLIAFCAYSVIAVMCVAALLEIRKWYRWMKKGPGPVLEIQAESREENPPPIELVKNWKGVYVAR